MSKRKQMQIDVKVDLSGTFKEETSKLKELGILGAIAFCEGYGIEYYVSKSQKNINIKDTEIANLGEVVFN